MSSTHTPYRNSTHHCNLTTQKLVWDSSKAKTLAPSCPKREDRSSSPCRELEGALHHDCNLIHFDPLGPVLCSPLSGGRFWEPPLKQNDKGLGLVIMSKCYGELGVLTFVLQRGSPRESLSKGNSLVHPWVRGPPTLALPGEKAASVPGTITSDHPSGHHSMLHTHTK